MSFWVHVFLVAAIAFVVLWWIVLVVDSAKEEANRETRDN